MIKSRRKIWVGHVACMGQKRVAYRLLIRKPEKKTMKTGLYGRIILKWILRHKCAGGVEFM
jgi:hypothetical protein